MDDRSKEQLSQDILEQRRQIEGYEITTKAEKLAARQQVADEIHRAENKARQRFEDERAKLQNNRENFLANAKDHFQTLLGEINEKEEEKITEFQDRFRERENTVLEKLLQLILP
ncbi:MAG: hypothetical protein ACFFE8_16315 [Candidatus Heimdallarchaeota archaeon]